MPEDFLKIYRKYYNDNPTLLATVLSHSESVARKALEIVGRKGLHVDRYFIYSAALLHDIGVVRCDAPSIFCYGHLPYICHGITGKKILEKEGLYRHAMICERHTGSGLSVQQIVSQNLPLPVHDMLPLSIEEKLICYADKFFSKSGDLTREKPLDIVMRQMAAHGEEALERFKALHNKFS